MSVFSAIPSTREPTRRVSIEIEGHDTFDEFVAVEITRDLKDFAGNFQVTARDAGRSMATFDFASPPPIFSVRPGPTARISIDGELVMVAKIERVRPEIDEERAEITFSGRDKGGNMVDCAAAPRGPGEFRNVKLEDAVRRIAEPFGIEVVCEIDTGRSFGRYPLELAETALSAIEKGARQRHALVMSDGTGKVILTRTGGRRAPAALTLPGNIKASSAEFSHENRYSETIVRGQGEKAGGKRADRNAAFGLGDDPVPPEDRRPGTGEATERERAGTAVEGTAIDEEIEDYRPIVFLAKTQADDISAADEADFRMRQRRAESEEPIVTVRDFRAGPENRLWRVNEIVSYSDAFQQIHRDMLISRTVMRYDEEIATEITLSSPEAFDPKPVGSRRTDMKEGAARSRSAKSRKPKAPAKPLDTTANAL
ncbi:Mu P family protein [Fulvimarina endophytica]|uniref:Mu P family protein n=1 Tax=Fulvimarina endophytica TaxID=2293836 RepID=A0A371X2Z3_9HYPH|nr:Mu P family protein [Fulvimarina endophytica]RFC63600.1 Mu P family protein [Fulvimarina endophytica]